ncbi:MAG: ATP-binding protein [Caldilineaceae bacterium]|nr:ATP-binding protein [Caldilineaceae bacterium]
MQPWRRLSLATNLDPAGAAIVSEKLEIASAPRNLTQIYESLDRFEAAAADARGPAVVAVFDAFKTAVVEIATNILRHAYPPDHPQAPLFFQLNLFAPYLEALFHDQGIAFTPPTEVALPNLDDILDVPEGNFGLFLALQALDHLEYTRTPAGVNQWRLIKQLH